MFWFHCCFKIITYLDVAPSILFLSVGSTLTLSFPIEGEGEISNYNQFVFRQQLAECVMPVEAGGLVEVVHIACGGFFRSVHCGEVVSLFIPGFGVIMGDFLAGLYSKPAFGECCPLIVSRKGAKAQRF